MFKPLPEFDQKQIMIEAAIHFQVSKNFEGAVSSGVIDVPYKVEYLPYERHSDALHLYDCYLTINDHYIKCSRLRASHTLKESFDAGDDDDMALTFFLFEQTIEKLVEMAELADAKRVFVGTDVPFADEVLVDKGFSLKRSEFNKANVKGQRKL